MFTPIISLILRIGIIKYLFLYLDKNLNFEFLGFGKCENWNVTQNIGYKFYFKGFE